MSRGVPVKHEGRQRHEKCYQFEGKPDRKPDTKQVNDRKKNAGDDGDPCGKEAKTGDDKDQDPDDCVPEILRARGK